MTQVTARQNGNDESVVKATRMYLQHISTDLKQLARKLCILLTFDFRRRAGWAGAWLSATLIAGWGRRNGLRLLSPAAAALLVHMVHLAAC